MKKSILLFGLVLAICAPVSAHFVFLVPDGPSKGKAVFSDSLKPDKEGVPVDKIANTKLWTISAGKTRELTWTLDKALNCYTFEVMGEAAGIVIGVTDYGVSQRGDAKPVWLQYYPKAIFGEMAGAAKAVGDPKVPVELTPIVDSGKLRFLATIKGKPVAKADVTVLVPGEEKTKVVQTDESGRTEGFEKAGQYGAYFKASEVQSGEIDGKKYEETRSYATLVVTFGK